MSLCECVCAPELGPVPAELHVGSEGAQVKSGLSYSQWSLFVVDSLLNSHDALLLSHDLLQDLRTQSHGNIELSVKQPCCRPACRSACVPVGASSPAGSWPLSSLHSADSKLGPRWSTGLSDRDRCPAALAPPAV